VRSIARDIGVSLWDQPGLDVPALLRANENRADIWLQPGQTEADYRWWIAHMLGHIMLDREIPTEHRAATGVGGAAGTLGPCIVANNWAAELLAPDWLVRPLLLSSYRSDRLAQIFGVSDAFMEARLRALYGDGYR